MCVCVSRGVDFIFVVIFFFFKQKTAYEMLRSLVGSEMYIRDSYDSDLDAPKALDEPFIHHYAGWEV